MTTGTTPRPMKHDADHYGLIREDAAGAHHGAGWWVSLTRRGHRIVRLFRDSIYGSSDAVYRQARACRDAILFAIPPAADEGQAVLPRKNSRSGTSEATEGSGQKLYEGQGFPAVHTGRNRLPVVRKRSSSNSTSCSSRMRPCPRPSFMANSRQP